MTRASTLARDATFVYALLIVYATLHPFSGWRDQGLSPLAWVGTWPKVFLHTDLAFNISAYVPFGILVVGALFPLVRGTVAVVIALLLGLTLSFSLESLQSYLPSRIPSLADLAANSIGTGMGAIIGALLAPSLLEKGALKAAGDRWFGARTPRSLILAALWLFASLYPQGMLFGFGSLKSVFGIVSGYPFTPAEFARVETAVTGTSLFAAGSLLIMSLTPHAPRILLTAAFIGVAGVARASSHAILFSPELGFAWLTPGAQQGLIAGAAALLVALMLPRAMLLALVAVAVTFSTVVVNLAPANPYYVAIVQTLNPGRFLNFNGLTQTVATMWPFLAVSYVLFSVAGRVEPGR